MHCASETTPICKSCIALGFIAKGWVDGAESSKEVEMLPFGFLGGSQAPPSEG